MQSCDFDTHYNTEFFKDLQYRINNFLSRSDPDHIQLDRLLHDLEWQQCSYQHFSKQIPALCRILRANTTLSKIMNENRERFPKFVLDQLSLYEEKYPAPPTPIMKMFFPYSRPINNSSANTYSEQSDASQNPFNIIDENEISGSQSSQSQSSQDASLPMDIEPNSRNDALILLMETFKSEGIVVFSELLLVTSEKHDNQTESLMVYLTTHDSPMDKKPLKNKMVTLIECLEQYAMLQYRIEPEPGDNVQKTLIYTDRDALIRLHKKIVDAYSDNHNLSGQPVDPFRDFKL